MYVNGKKLAHHDGGYSTWRVDITDSLENTNLFVIAVDNSKNDRVYPQNADFTFYGGLYRDVNIIAVPEAHFDLEYYGAPGIKVTPIITGDDSVVDVEVFTSKAAEGATLKYVIKDAQGNVVGEQVTSDKKVTFDIKNVHL